MSKRLIYVPFWEAELVELLNFLKEHKYTESEIAAIEHLVDKEKYSMDNR